MVFHHHRKLMPEICESLCHMVQNCSSNCDDCLKIYITNPQYYYYSQPLPPPLPLIPPLPLDDTSDHGKSQALSPYLVLALSVIGAAFFVVICCAIFARIFTVESLNTG
ncbi:hypothetical protein Ahy_B06g083332 [Arachis hypogaea]|uniref:Uncharacterized protein n=1 Tax=Arachis hypogaea TaxID=3818 RepID=A0A444YPT5_ARAHY|nr:hypothetical protein Ahy_B06g083332 [Arachis hypogaea]